jgi:hypothetical protein
MKPTIPETVRRLLLRDDLPIDDQAYLHNLECAIRRQGDAAITEAVERRVQEIQERADARQTA